MSVVRSFAQRLLVQAIVSSTVMAGIQLALRYGPEVFPVQADPAGIERAQATVPPEAATIEPLREAAFAQDRTHADVKAGRFPVWRERDAPAAAIPPERLASKGPGTGLSDVLLFDKCRPGCESRDPLLAFNQRRDNTASAPAGLLPELPDDVVVPSLADAAEAGERLDHPSNGGGVIAAARGSMSWARRMVGTAGSAVGW